MNIIRRSDRFVAQVAMLMRNCGLSREEAEARAEKNLGPATPMPTYSGDEPEEAF